MSGSFSGTTNPYTIGVGSGLTITATFTVTSYSVTFTESGLPLGTSWSVTFNSVTQSSTTTTITFTGITSGSYSWTASTSISGGTGTRYVASTSSGTMDVPSQTSQSITYTTQYYLTVSSAYGTTSGAGWYNSGATAYAGLTSGTVSGGTGIQYVFTSWGTDASGTNYASSNGITMSGPKTATANWQTQYLVHYVATGNANPITVPSDEWINSGGVATGTFPSPVTVGGVKDTFVSDNRPATITAPTTIVGTYKTQYYLTVQTDPSGVATISGEGWYDKSSSVSLTAPLMIGDQYLFAYWDVDENPLYFGNSINIIINGTHTATAVYKEFLADANQEISSLETYVTKLYKDGKIGKKECESFTKALSKIGKEIDKAMKQFDRTRYGFDDRQKGFEDLRHAVMKFKSLIRQVEDWAQKGKIPASDAASIITELETIRMKLLNKAYAEALAEKDLALKAIADAKASGKDTTKAEEEITKVDTELAKAIQSIAEGKLSQAIQHFKHAFTHSQHAIKKAYDKTWTTDYKDWIDELEEEDP
jgi:hypothetical protein